MPPDMPREDYATPALYTLSTLSRVLRYVLYGTVLLSVSSLAAFEALHAYVESSIPPSRSDGDDAYAWADENEPWTGGSRGGTDARLGWKARHALRGAWIAWHWGAGGAAAIGKGDGRGVHPDLDLGRRGMIAEPGAAGGLAVNRVDRGYELADEYVDVALAEARRRGLVFPPTLSGARRPGPPADDAATPAAVLGDPAVLDLLAIKAAVQERLNTPASLRRAKDTYETVLVSTVRGAPARGVGAAGAAGAAEALRVAREMRGAKKLGDLCARLGDADEAEQWWSWGLARADVHPAHAGALETASEAAAEVKSWFSWSRAGPAPTAPPAVPAAASAVEPAPPVQRATAALLLSLSTHRAQSAATLRLAHATQTYALSCLPAPPPTAFTTPTTSDAPAALHALWLAQRRDLVALHATAVSHALGAPADAAAADAAADALLPALRRLGALAAVTKASSPLAAPFEQLERDARATAAEAAYTHGALLERAAPAAGGRPGKNSKAGAAAPAAAEDVARLEVAHECYERALALAADDAKDDAAQSDEWARYWRAHVRVRAKLESVVEAA